MKKIFRYGINLLPLALLAGCSKGDPYGTSQLAGHICAASFVVGVLLGFVSIFFKGFETERRLISAAFALILITVGLILLG